MYVAIKARQYKASLSLSISLPLPSSLFTPPPLLLYALSQCLDFSVQPTLDLANGPQQNYSKAAQAAACIHTLLPAQLYN